MGIALVLTLLIILTSTMALVFVVKNIIETVQWPEEAWRAIGDSKTAWLILQIATIQFLAAGSILYFIRARPKLQAWRDQRDIS